MDLTVTLAEGSKAQSIGLVDPSGSSVATRQISTGQTKATLPLIKDGQPLSPGTYEVVAGHDGSTIDKQSVKLTAGWKLTKVRSHKSPMYGVPTEIAMTVKNTGKLPLKLANLSVEGVPSPTDALPTRINAEAAEIDKQQLIGVDQSAAFRTETRPFEYGKSAKSPCGTTKQAMLNLTVKPTGTQRFNASVRYSGGTVSTPQLTTFCKTVTIKNVSKQS